MARAGQRRSPPMSWTTASQALARLRHRQLLRHATGWRAAEPAPGCARRAEPASWTAFVSRNTNSSSFAGFGIILTSRLVLALRGPEGHGRYRQVAGRTSPESRWFWHGESRTEKNFENRRRSCSGSTDGGENRHERNVRRGDAAGADGRHSGKS